MSSPDLQCEEVDYRRWTDNILHWQERPYVYPFSKEKEGESVRTAPPAMRYTSMYNSDFVQKPISTRRLRPTSINRMNKPHPRRTFHLCQISNKSVPVVKTKLTLEELNRKLADSPMISSTHRSYRGTKLKLNLSSTPSEGRCNLLQVHRDRSIYSADKAKAIRGIEKPADGIVPEIPRDGERVEVRLFPVIPRNARLTADRATKITNAVIKPQANKKQPHLRGSVSAIMRSEKYVDGPIYPFLPVKDLNRHALKPLTGQPDTMRVPSWDGAPLATAPTIQDMYGRKRRSDVHDERPLVSVVPDLPAPTSKELMFKEYAQYPKYAPQMLDGYYNSMNTRRLVRPYVW